jgi:hypothetical protein
MPLRVACRAGVECPVPPDLFGRRGAQDGFPELADDDIAAHDVELRAASAAVAIDQRHSWFYFSDASSRAALAANPTSRCPSSNSANSTCFIMSSTGASSSSS